MNKIIKKFFSSLLMIIFLLSSQVFLNSSEIFAEGENGLNANFSWDSESYQNVTKLEFILDLKGSVLEQGIKSDKKRVKVKDIESDYKILSVANVNKYEEKLVLRLTGKNNKYIDFVNFETPYKNKKFHDISLIEHNGKIKAKVVIYIHKYLDLDVYNALNNGIKSAKYLYFGIKKGKPYKKARAIKLK